MADPIKLLLLAGIAGGLAWGGSELLRDNRLPPPPQVEVQETTVDGIRVPAMEPAPLDSFAAIVERPLFFEDRQPLQAVEVEQATPAASAVERMAQSTPPNMRLSAIVIDGDQRIALVEIPGSDGGRQLDEGQSLSGWTVVAIDDTGLTMQSGAQQHRFKLMDFPQPQQLPSTATPFRGARTRPR